MAGFENDVLVCKNVNFDTTAPKPHLGIITLDGQLLIGSITSHPDIAMKAGSITSDKLVIGYSEPNITINTNDGNYIATKFSMDIGGVMVPDATGTTIWHGGFHSYGAFGGTDNPLISRRISSTVSEYSILVASAQASSQYYYAGVSFFDSSQFNVDPNGFVTLVAGGPFVTSVSGTLNRITSTGGTTPVIDISASYVGQTSITTLGTISTGVWNGTTIDVAHGGTSLTTLTAHALYVGNGTSAPTALSTGSTGQVLQANTGADPSWSTPTYPSTSGTAGKVIISDGTNNVYSTPTFPNASATIRKIIVSDGTNWVASTETWATPGSSGNILTSNGTNWTSAAPATNGTVTSVSGTANQVSVANGTTTPVISLIGPYTPATYTAHGVLIGEGTSSIVALAAGSAGQILRSGGASADPAYSTATYPATATGTGTVLRADGTNIVASTFTIPDTAAQGDILYASASNVWSSLAKDTNSTRVLTNTGSSNNPAWAQVNLTTGVTGTLPVANGGTSLATLTAHALYVGNGTSAPTALAVGTTGQVLQGNTGADPSWGTASSGGLTWSVISADQTAAVNNGYFCNKGTVLTLTMPGTAAVGDTIAVINVNIAAGTKILSANPGTLNFGNQAATANTGTITSTALGDALFLVCRTANQVWYAYGAQGNWTVA